MWIPLGNFYNLEGWGTKRFERRFVYRRYLSRCFVNLWINCLLIWNPTINWRCTPEKFTLVTIAPRAHFQVRRSGAIMPSQSRGGPRNITWRWGRSWRETWLRRLRLLPCSTGTISTHLLRKLSAVLLLRVIKRTESHRLLSVSSLRRRGTNRRPPRHETPPIRTPAGPRLTTWARWVTWSSSTDRTPHFRPSVR